MQSTQKASEPSMEDILASIRKIIADDPAAPPLSAPNRPPIQTPVAPRTATAPAPVHPSGPRPGMMSLDKELTDLLSDPAHTLAVTVAVPNAFPTVTE